MRRLLLGLVVTLLASSWASAQFIQQGSALVGTGAMEVAGQADSVAISADGNTAIVGGPTDNGNLGAAWVFTRSDEVWTQQGEKLVGTGAVGSYINQGEAVALSADGNTAIVGGPDDGELGAAWVFTRSGGVWTQQGQKLVGTSSGPVERQGVSVAISADGNTAIVGGPYDNGGVGAAWVFTRSGGVWTQQGERLVGTGAIGMSVNLGSSISVALSADGNTAVVGRYQDNASIGAAWVFTRSAGVWTQQGEKLVGSGAVGDALQGFSVALSADGNTAIVGGFGDNGGVGAAWVFTRSGGVWTQQREKLVGARAAGNAHQGVSVALSANGDIAIVGGPEDNGGIGATWVFTRSGGVWTQQGEKLVGAIATGSGHQGASVALSGTGDTAIVGGPGDNGYVGAAWVFIGPGGTRKVLWIPVVVHKAGLNGSQWRSDLGLLNPGTTTANVQLTFHGPEGVVTNTTYVPAATQSILVDVVAQLGTSGRGALEVSSDQPLKVTSRTYNQVPSDATCDPGGTQGQDYPAVVASDGLSETQAAWLPHLIENTAYRTNIGLLNAGTAPATATVELYDGAGNLLTSYTVSLASAEWSQVTQPFKYNAEQTAMDRGYARVIATSGGGVVALASVIDNITNDPTTITMQR